MEGALPLSSLRLLAAPLRVMLAVMWKVVRQRNVKHYGKVVEFVSLVTEAIPDILTDSQMRLLTLGLRAKVTLQMLRSGRSDDLRQVRTHLDSLLPTSSEQLGPQTEGLEDNFVQLIQRLLEDAKGREHFLEDVFPVEFGPNFDTALETMVCDFFSRLEELLLIPNFKQTAVWISDTSSVLEEYMQCVTNTDDLRVLLRSKVHHGKMAKMDSSEFSVPLSSLALLVPPLRLMSAVMWEVVRQRNIKHYGKLEEFVSMVTDAVPELMSKREGRLLSLGLRARTTLELLRSEHPEDLKAVETHLNRIRSSCIEETNDPIIEAPEANFMKLVQGLIEDTDGREHFLKNVFPVEYGPDFDTALETLVCEFFTRLEELLPIPDFKQTASWISAAPSVLEEYMQCVSNGDDLKFLLQSKQCHGKLAKSSIAPFQSDDLLIPSLSLPPSLEVAIASHPSACDDENNDVPQIVMFDEELSTNPSTSTDFPESPKQTDIPTSPHRRQQSAMHKCSECDKCFKHHSVLIEHQRVHTGLQPYNCSECGRAFRTATLLAGHRLRKCKNAAYLCIKCGNSFPTSLDKFRHHCPKRGRHYDCGHCGKRFQKSSSLKEHLLTHVQNRLFKCSHCGVGFSGIGDLKYHQQVDHDKPYQCKQCGKSFITSKCLAKHQQRHQEVGEMETAKLMSGGKHRKSGSAHRTSSSSLSSRKTSNKSVYPRGRVIHNCPLCGRSFKYRFEFLEHQRFHTAVKPYKCSQCGKSFRTEVHLSGHRRRKCKNAAHICTKCGCQFRSLHERLRHQCVQLLTKYECSHCGKTFKMAHLLRNHQMSEHQLPYSPNHRFRCRYCEETFPGISELKYHQRVDHEKPYQCQECGKCFLSEKCLANHELRHNNDRPESCLVCGRGFRNRYDLKQHMRTHTGERPYQCTHCSQCFSTAGGLRSHTRVHTGEKPHVCPDCGKGFSQIGAMRTHRLTHTGERPFKCTVCGKGFTMAHKVTVHMRVHTGERPYVCTQCGKAFSDGSVLKQHMLNHSGVRPYHCQICPKTYTCLNHLRRHLKSHSNMN
ncbi:zinc finger protein 420-like isoform X2 [Paralichthys olivaceus]|uniref:zinc finger protein 420-like isoform X2 n=1 Tax=Paralichthys olivaceus TaxID=8255 RepID=UPI003752CB56